MGKHPNDDVFCHVSFPPGGGLARTLRCGQMRVSGLVSFTRNFNRKTVGLDQACFLPERERGGARTSRPPPPPPAVKEDNKFLWGSFIALRRHRNLVNASDCPPKANADPLAENAPVTSRYTVTQRRHGCGVNPGAEGAGGGILYIRPQSEMCLT